MSSGSLSSSSSNGTQVRRTTAPGMVERTVNLLRCGAIKVLRVLTRPVSDLALATHYAFEMVDSNIRIETGCDAEGVAITEITTSPEAVGFTVERSVVVTPEIANRLIEAITGWKPYCLFANNCEHLVNYVISGRFFSQQVETFRAIIAALILLLSTLLASTLATLVGGTGPGVGPGPVTG